MYQMAKRLIKLGYMSDYHFLQDFEQIANESYRDYLKYVDTYLLSNYANILINVDQYATFRTDFIPAHDAEFTRIAKAINAKYDPINNYDMTEKSTDTTNPETMQESTSIKGDKINTRELQGDTTTITTNEESVIESNNLKVSDKQTATTTPNDYKETSKETYNNYNKTVTTSPTKEGITTHELTRSGNIGVTTTQQMIDSTFDLERRNKIVHYIAKTWIEEMTTGIYDFEDEEVIFV